ncbi:MAG: hypothetical protein HRT58_00340 [Crocinitomicaceae bacterium]|nr:hypothetical protein [Flavobacteriales bacterium]NQZ34069.1 hypothetical protein [Crocinitomicaceae bacterium]
MKKIINCEFKKGGKIENIKIGKALIFEDCLFSKNHNDDEFIIENVYEGRLTFKQSNIFQSKVVLSGLNNLKTDVEGTFHNELKIVGGSCELSLRGVGKLLSTFSDISFSNIHDIKYLLFRDLEQKGSITFYSSVPKSINFAQGNFDTIKFHNVKNLPYLKIGSLETKSNILSIAKFELPDCSLAGKMEFVNVKIESFVMKYFKNQNGDTLFRNVEFSGDVTFEHGDLSNVRFIDVNFLNAKINFNSSLLTESIFSNIIWPKKNLIHPNLAIKKYWKIVLKGIFKKKAVREKNNRDEVLLLKRQREIYRQLKVISQNNMSTIDMLAFHRNEMRVYWSNMRLSSELTRGDHFLVFLDRYVSNFGQSYARPFFFLLFFQFIVCLFIWRFEVGSFSYLFESSFSEGAKQYANWLIPIYKAPETWGAGATIVGVMGRVFSGFFIFHIIKATRKFGKI